MDRFIVRTPRLNLPKPVVATPSTPDQDLPNPNLFDDPETARDANEAAKAATMKSGKRSNYNIVSLELKAKVGKYAAESGVNRARRHFQSQIPFTLKHSTVHGWKNEHLARLRNAKDSSVRADRPLLLGKEIDDKIQEHLHRLRGQGGIVNGAVVNAVTRVYLKKMDRSRYRLEGEEILSKRSFSQSLMRRMGFVKRKGTKAAKKLPRNFDELRQNFFIKIGSLVKAHEIPDQLIIIFDQTGISIIPTSSYTMEKEGAKQLPVIGKDEKRQIAVVFAVSLAGELLPPKLIYGSKTDACHPKYRFPHDWLIDHTDNHWSTAASIIVRYARSIVIPYVCAQRLKLGLSEEKVALVISDTYNAHRHNNQLHQLLKDNNIEFVYVPAACTGELQPLDAESGPNAIFKRLLKTKFSMWYSQELMEKLQVSDEPQDINVPLSLTVLKPLHAAWVEEAFVNLQKHDLKVCWSNTGISSFIKDMRHTMEVIID
uniref:DDE-1 domain-containing protein n=1 Tax=Plectus sambesii TaxID=2011161 RepID=A0A914W0M0_9BILA